MHTLTITYNGPPLTDTEREIRRLEDEIWSLEYGADIEESEYEDDERAAKKRAEAAKLRVELEAIKGAAPKS
jgi:hypothetical protein